MSTLRVHCPPLLEALDELEHPLDLDVLQIDAEGMDDEVLYACAIAKTSPSIILLEQTHLSPARKQKLKQYLEQDYFLSIENRDLLAIRRTQTL